MQTKRFQRRAESFTCAHCSAHVEGTGYTDHCPKCLFSKHVDVNPGDRAANCEGLMKPICAAIHGGETTLYYQCECGYRHKIKAAEDDNREIVFELLQVPTPAEFT